LRHQLPGTLVGHVHGSARRRDRALPLDLLQQRDLAGAEPALVVEVDADAEMGHRTLLTALEGYTLDHGEHRPAWRQCQPLHRLGGQAGDQCRAVAVESYIGLRADLADLGNLAGKHVERADLLWP